MVQESTKTSVSNYFLNNYSLNLPQDWLTQCLEFIAEEFPNANPRDYNELIFKQLQDFDLTEIGTHCLPEQILNKPNGAINGKYLLQILVCIDSSQPYFGQIQKLRGLLNENALVDADIVPTHTQFEFSSNSKNRLLTMILTDGTEIVKGIEFQAWRNLTEEMLLPGTKVQLQGAINFRNKVLFLSSENIKVIGGNVENITTSEHFVQCIEHELNEKRSNEKSISDREKVKNFDSIEIKSNFNQNKMKTEYQSQTLAKSQTTSCYNNKPMTAPNKNAVHNESDDEDEDALLMNCNLDQIKLEKNTQNVNNSNNNNKFNQCKSTTEIYHNFQYNPNQASAKIKRPPSTEYISSLGSSTSQSNKESYKISLNNKKAKIDTIDDLEDDDDFKILEAIQTVESNINKPQSNKAAVKDLTNQITPKVAPKYLIEDLIRDQEDCCFINQPSNLDEVNCLSTCDHVLVGQFKTMTAQLKQAKLKWYQECIIEDETSNCLQAYIGNDPLAELLELTCAQAKELFIRSKQQSQMDQSSNGSFTEDYNTLFARKRKNCEEALKANKFKMNLKYDFNKSLYCIYKMTKTN